MTRQMPKIYTDTLAKLEELVGDDKPTLLFTLGILARELGKEEETIEGLMKLNDIATIKHLVVRYEIQIKEKN